MNSLQLNLTTCGLIVMGAAAGSGAFMALSQSVSVTKKIALASLTVTSASFVAGSVKAWADSSSATTLSEYSTNVLNDTHFYLSKFANVTYENTDRSTKLKINIFGFFSLGYEHTRSVG